MLFCKGYVLDCRRVFWVGATTDWGKLIPAFRTRFRRIDLVPPTFDQVVQMVEGVMSWDKATCRQVVKFGGLVPRETFAFARAVKDAAERGGLSVAQGIAEVAQREQIDAHGMRVQRLRVLLALKAAGDDGCLLRTLVMASGCQQEELLGHWLPSMLVAPPGG
jgi:Holliday junction resolvasome RuvABC ATP-dependent DNA helicase subunit